MSRYRGLRAFSPAAGPAGRPCPRSVASGCPACGAWPRWGKRNAPQPGRLHDGMCRNHWGGVVSAAPVPGKGLELGPAKVAKPAASSGFRRLTVPVPEGKAIALTGIHRRVPALVRACCYCVRGALVCRVMAGRAAPRSPLRGPPSLAGLPPGRATRSAVFFHVRWYTITTAGFPGLRHGDDLYVNRGPGSHAVGLRQP